MTAALKLIGTRFGLLVVTGRAENNRHGQARWECKCDCGTSIVTAGANLRIGDTTSCGCHKRAILGVASKTHGHTNPKTRTYTSWYAMLRRVRDPNRKHYGGRGITVCERWLSFENFLADMGERPIGMTIDRKDVDGNYEPDNCRWATNAEQAANRRPRK